MKEAHNKLQNYLFGRKHQSISLSEIIEISNSARDMDDNLSQSDFGAKVSALIRMENEREENEQRLIA